MSRSFECPSCALEVVVGAGAEAPAECPYCGYEFPERKRGVAAAAWLMAALMLLPLLWLLARLLG